MTYLQSSAVVQRTPQSASRPPIRFPALLDNRDHLEDALATKRAAVKGLELAWVAAAEADAARAGTRNVPMDDRSTWDRTTWDRYLTAALTYEPDYKPRIKRLLKEIDHLESLPATPEATIAHAA